MNLYRVSRPYCTPWYVIVVASSMKRAKELVNKKFGFANRMKAVRIDLSKEKVINSIE
jgi:hypothetical protein